MIARIVTTVNGAFILRPATVKAAMFVKVVILVKIVILHSVLLIRVVLHVIPAKHAMITRQIVPLV